MLKLASDGITNMSKVNYQKKMNRKKMENTYNY